MKVEENTWLKIRSSLRKFADVPEEIDTHIWTKIF